MQRLQSSRLASAMSGLAFTRGLTNVRAMRAGDVGFRRTPVAGDLEPAAKASVEGIRMLHRPLRPSNDRRPTLLSAATHS
jgi:hypothetical protein